MKKSVQIITVALAVAMALTLSCSTDDNGGSNDPSEGITTSSSSSIGGAYSSSSFRSSSSNNSSSSVVVRNVVYGDPVIYEGETYQTVVIGTQTWFKRNLNYNASGSVCYSFKDANCEIYGRLYNWATAMDLSADCNSENCASLVQTKHKGICPQGWHIPSNADWNTLMKFVNSNCSDNTSCAGAGTKLKATNGWEDYMNTGNGTDDYGFSALPGGHHRPHGYFNNDVGNNGYWWSASEHVASLAYARDMYYRNEGVNYDSHFKDYLYSVRCLQD